MVARMTKKPAKAGKGAKPAEVKPEAKQASEPVPPASIAPTPESKRLAEAQSKLAAAEYDAASPLGKALLTRAANPVPVRDGERMLVSDVVSVEDGNFRESFAHLWNEKTDRKTLGGLAESIAVSGQNVPVELFYFHGAALESLRAKGATKDGKPTSIDEKTPILARGHCRVKVLRYLSKLWNDENSAKPEGKREAAEADPFRYVYVMTHAKSRGSKLDLVEAYGDQNARTNATTLYELAKFASMYRDAGLTQSAIGALFGVSTGQVQVWERLWSLPTEVLDEARRYYVTAEKFKRGQATKEDVAACVEFTHAGINRLERAHKFHCFPSGDAPTEKLNGKDEPIPAWPILWKSCVESKKTEAPKGAPPYFAKRDDVVKLFVEVSGKFRDADKGAALAVLGFILGEPTYTRELLTTFHKS